ncbi:MAG: DUF5016 domain-containing protein [Dysgonamonadaceae bacterium]|jgi:hypothetical protein|nr:DUF5016 domain-containing protein [Dysgonamonadaceae bacterium]
MKKIDNIFLISIAALFLAASCDDNRYGDPPQASVPVITSAAIEPATFTYGDSVTITAAVSDAEIPLSTLTVNLVVDNKTVPVTTLDLRTGETSANVSSKIFIPLVENMPDNASLKFVLTLANTRTGKATHELAGFTGKRPYFTQLYLVTDAGEVYPLTPQAANRDNYSVTDVVISRAFTYRIAQKITADNQIDYSGLVWGDNNGKIQLIDETGNGIFAFAAGSDITTSFMFDNYQFRSSQTGAAYATPNFMLDDFSGTTIDGEEFYTLATTLTKNQEYNVYNDLASQTIVYNVDFFERINANKVKFLGETGSYTLYYNKTSQYVVLLPIDSPAYPDYILITGGGIGYPSKIAKEHAWWGFGNVRNFLLTRKIAANVYQVTMFIHAKDDGWVSFKPYENTGWGGEKTYSNFTYSGIALDSPDGNNIYPSADMEEGIYRLTIDWSANTINVASFTLP